MGRSKRSEPKFSTSGSADAIALTKIAARAAALAERNGVEYAYMDAMMDVDACHSNGCPLRLHALLEADDFNFSHDVMGIRSHLDRGTGKLQDHFLPRFAA